MQSLFCWICTDWMCLFHSKWNF